MLFLGAVVIAALNWGRGPAIWASLLSVVAFDFLFVTPYLTFAVSDTQYVLTFLALLGVGLVMSTLAARAREQAESAQQREAETAELYDLSRDLAATPELAGILRTLVKHVENTFGREAAILLPSSQPQGSLTVHAASPGLELEPNELAVADWVYRHGQPAGRGTNTLPAAKLRYLPLITARGVVGVFGIHGSAAPEQYLTPKQRRLMEAFANQAALAIERANLAEAARQAQVLQVAERLQTALLNSVSHDLRTPLVSITGALSSLEEDGALHDEASRHSLITNARAEAERLNRLVGNLLQMTRLEAGTVTVSRVPTDLREVIGSALDQLNDALAGRPVSVDVPDDLPFVPLDAVLIGQVLLNLLDNALKYSPPGSPIDVTARVAGAYVEVSVADRGVGIPTEDLQRVFDKFYRVERPNNVSGTGLGLSIGKGIVEAHGGFIGAENRPGGGTIITMVLPLS